MLLALFVPGRTQTSIVRALPVAICPALTTSFAPSNDKALLATTTGVSVAVGGAGVFVAVGGTGVFVAVPVTGTGVFVGVGGIGVFVGGKGVLVGIAVGNSGKG
jgi:hypothetical protein